MHSHKNCPPKLPAEIGQRFMNAQINCTIEYKVTYHQHTFESPLEKHLNDYCIDGWILHSIFESKVIEHFDNDKIEVTIYRCIWQRILQQQVLGIIK